MKQKLLHGSILLFLLFSFNNLSAQSVFINELHYDNAGADNEEGVEIAGPAGTDLTGWTIALYNGNNNGVYGTLSLDGSIPDLQGGFGVLSFSAPGIQNGPPDGLALVNASGELMQFLSYEGTITAIDGPAAGTSSTDIGVYQDGQDPIGHSLQLSGEGNTYAAFIWQTPSENTFGGINTDQSFGGEITDPEPEPEPQPEPANSIVFINEIHYDNASTDVDEGFEVAGTAGTDLAAYNVLLYNGTNGTAYNNMSLEGIIPDQQNGYGTVSFILSVNGMQNGAPDGLALVKNDEVLQFLSYEGEMVATEGPAVGMTSTDIGVAEGSSTPEGYSLQLTGEGSYYEDFTWAAEAQNTFGTVNTAQTFISPEPVLFVNELHYDTYSTDSGEGVEVAGTAGLDLSEYSIIFYNGSNGQSYRILNLEGTLPNLQSGYGTAAFMLPSNGIQNGDPDGFALVKGDEVLQFLSYEGTFTADNGPAAGMESTEIGVSENGVTAGHSLQLGGVGFNYEDFTWQEAQANTFGAVNSNQTFGTETIDPQPEPEPTVPGTIAHARAAEIGTKLSIEGTLTVTDHHGNTAYIQDETGGIAIYGNLVTEVGKFSIGDSIRVTGTRAVYNELIQISDVESVEYLGVANEPIEPVKITLSELDNYRGQLVKITDMTFPDPGQLFFGNANYEVSDASGSAELRIDSDVASLVGKTQPETCAEVVGVVGRYNDINQLLPRNYADLPCAEEFNPEYPGSEISRDLTFDAVTWNIEWFGDEANSPAARNENSDEIQKEAVKAALLKMDADVIAVNEISDDVLFAQMVSEMEGYNFILSNATSYPDSPGGQKVGFIYNTNTVDVTNSRAMFTSVHPFYEGDGSLLQDYPESADRFYASGRLPFLMEANVTINGQTTEMKFIALHARANSSTGAQGRYDMRKYDVEVLKDSLDHYFANDRVMIMGDYNDDLDYTVANVSTIVTTYDSFIQDNENYSFPTLALSEAGYRTYVVGNYNDVIDHIMITNELDYSYIKGSARVHYELYNSDYTYTTSDHFPVSVRMVLSELKVGSIETSGVLCSEEDVISATVTPEGGIAPYTYLWSNGQETATATGLSAGTYSVEVTDVLGNTVTSEVTLESSTPIVISMIEDQTVYTGYQTDCTTLSAVSITGGEGAYTYEWNTGETTATIEVCPAETTVYTLLVTDENGCTAEANVTVNVEDISCGNKGDKVLLCHNGNSICVAPQAVPALLRNGATFGSCEDEAAEIVIEEVTAYPNPTLADSQIRITAVKRFEANLVVYDLNGNPLNSQQINVTEGASDFPVNLGRFPKGVYLVKVLATGFESHALKIIKQ